MGPCSGARRQNVPWVTVIWVSSALGAAVGGAVELKVPRELTPRCGANVTLTCEANVSEQDIKKFSWVFRNKSCSSGGQQRDLTCESACGPLRCSLTLALVNVMPVDNGEYLCKLHSKLGVNNTKSVVTAEGCLGSMAPSFNQTHASCCFSGVYPKGVVHWSRGGVNLTESSSWDAQEADGRYNICGAVGVDRKDASIPYLCSLWIHAGQKYLAKEKMFVVGGQGPSSRVTALQGLLVVLEVLVLKLLT